MKQFTSADIRPGYSNPDTLYLDVNREDLFPAPLDWQKRGLQETASGYGAKLTTVHMLCLDGRMYRVYCTCYSNNGTCYITRKGQKIIVS